MVTGIEPVFNDRLNPGNNLLVRITVSRYWRYYVVGCVGLRVWNLLYAAVPVHGPEALSGCL